MSKSPLISELHREETELLHDFKTFLMRGNVVDLAVGVVIGAAFGKIVDSLVKDVIMPPIGMLLGNVDFANIFITLKHGSKLPGPYESLKAAQDAGAVTVNIGLFLNAIISFLIIGMAVFLLVKVVSKFKHHDEAPVAALPTTKECPYCYSAIPIKATRCPCCTSEITAAAS